MAHWLLKTEPDCYSWDDLVRDKRTVWDGVTNALALKHIRSMSNGDTALTFAGWELLRIGRLSVVPVPQPMWDRILELSAESP